MTLSGDSIALRERVLIGRAALTAELVTIVLMTIIVVIVYLLGVGAQLERDLLIPLLALGLGLAGAWTAGDEAAGYIRHRGYVVTYAVTILVMMGIDLAVRAWLGGELARVPGNWAVLIGSASAVNLLVTRLPRLTARHWIDESNIRKFHPVAWVIVIVFQLGQAWISVLGAPLGVALVQLLARRLAIVPITHVIARRNYGADAAQLLTGNHTLEYLAVRAVASAEGRVVEPERLEQTVVGMLLLKLPIFAGEPMNAGRKSLTRVVDKLVFVEQMLAFSSPTMVVNHATAIGHVAFIHTMLSVHGDPAQQNPQLDDRGYCKQGLHRALGGSFTAANLDAVPPRV
jgi:hypothetical protein